MSEKLKVLVVEEQDFDGYGDWLCGEAGVEFINGGYTHIVSIGEDGKPVVGEAHVVDLNDGTKGVQTGEQVSNDLWRCG